MPTTTGTSPSDLDLALNGGTLVGGSGRARLHVGIRDGRVAVLSPTPLAARETVDATDLLVLPGMVDTHVHLMDPGPTEREDFPTGTLAAATAGVTTVVEHTHAHPVRGPGDLRAKREHLKGRAHVDYGLAAHLWPEDIPHVAATWAAGVTFFKIFTCTTHGVPALPPGFLLPAFEALAEAGAPCLVHCEDETLTAEAEKVLRASGRDDGGVVPAWRSREAELVAVHAALVLAAHSRVRATLAHVSAPEAAAAVAAARARGADVAAEACPQYFLLREDEILEHGPLRKFTPPARARSDADEQEMWRLLRAGAFGHLSTDHAPSTRAQKSAGDIWEAPFGLPGLDTTLPIALDAALRGLLALEDVVRLYAEAPARRYGLYPRKGRLAEGADADLVLVDPTARRTLRDEDVRSKAGWTPYAGREVRARVVATYLRGTRVVDDGRVDAEPSGAFLPGRGARS